MRFPISSRVEKEREKGTYNKKAGAGEGRLGGGTGNTICVMFRHTDVIPKQSEN